MTDLKPGRELDALIAEKVMGLILERDCTVQNVVTGVYLVSRNPFQVAEIPHYSTSIADAWEVVEKLESDGFLPSMYSNEEWEVEFNKNDGRFLQSADTVGFGRALTAAHAICLAALKAVEGKA
jgi:hypothetical protein